MNIVKTGVVLILVVALSSCAATKKAAQLGEENQKLHIDVKNCQDQLADSKSQNDKLNANVLGQLTKRGVELVALSCAAYNNVDLEA